MIVRGNVAITTFTSISIQAWILACAAVENEIEL